MLCYGSLHLAGAWNASVGNITGLNIAEETALRFPNALFGALTVIPLLLFASSLFGFRTGLIASLLWAVGLNAVWINRVGKEDTLLVFFMLFTFLSVVVTEVLLVRQLSRLTGQQERTNVVTTPPNFVPGVEPQALPARAPGEPIPSVTENTTRLLDNE